MVTLRSMKMRRKKVVVGNRVRFGGYEGLVVRVNGSMLAVRFSVSNWPFPCDMEVAVGDVELIEEEVEDALL